MYDLATDQPLFTDAAWRVVTGGPYEATDLVPVYRVSDPIQVVAHFAQFIVDGTYP